MMTYTFALLACLPVGWLVGTYWVLPLPTLAVTTWLLVNYMNNPSCALTCDGDDTWAEVVFVAAMFFVALPTVALFTGVMARRVGRDHR